MPLFLFFWAAFDMSGQISGHTQSGLKVAWIFVCLLPDHMYPFECFRSITWTESRPHSNDHQFSLSCNTSRFVQLALVTPMYFSGLGMFLLSARKAELEVRRDDHEWNLLQLTKSHCGLLRHLLCLLVEKFPNFLKVFFETFTYPFGGFSFQ